MLPITERGLKALNLTQYNELNEPFLVALQDVKAPAKRVYVLRMLIKRPFEDLQIPTHLKWVKPIIGLAFASQRSLGINQPFCYLTVRHGLVDTVTDDEWHVDGFSTTITHLPEQNYIWASHTPTEYIIKKIAFPNDFDTQKHNIHQYFQDNITADDKIHTAEAKGVYCMDPYVIHRRPAGTNGQHRTFIRVSFTPIEIIDCNNTLNPLMPTNYKRDAVNEFRNKLVRYEK